MAKSANFQLQPQNAPFWTKPTAAFPVQTAIAHSGFLYSREANTQLTPLFYVLTASRLLKVQWWTETEVRFLEGNLQWTTIEAFEERDREQTSRFGFNLRRGDWGCDFYVVGKGELDGWLEKLGEVAILGNIQEDYEMQGEIGRGGQSVVYMGRFRANGMKVAIKSYEKRQLAESKQRGDSLRSEIEILRFLSHPSLAKLHRVYESDLTIDLVMDFYDGIPLSKALFQPFTETESFKFMLNLLDILDFLSDKHIVHRDIKPENIILTDRADRANFKLIDFGLAKWYEGVDLCDGSGSPGYYAPEILKKRTHGPKVDIYAAGVLFYTLLEGVNPFHSPTIAETIRRNLENDITFNSSVWRGVSPTVISVIRVMTNLNPDERMNAHDLHTWLLRISGLKPVHKKLFPRRLSAQLDTISLRVGNSSSRERRSSYRDKSADK